MNAQEPRGAAGTAEVVSLWLIHCEHELNARTHSALEQSLGGNELAKMHGMKDAGRRAEYLIAHSTLRRLIGSRLDIAPAAVQFAVQGQGRPCLHQKYRQPLQFSISHTSGMVAVALHASATVGVDVESLRQRHNARILADRFFHPAEKSYVDEAKNEPEAERRLLQCWTMKEAWFKAFGGSTSWALSELCFAFDASRRVVEPLLPANEAVRLTTTCLWSAEPSAGHLAALAWEAGSADRAATVRCLRLLAVDMEETPIELGAQYAWPAHA